MTFVAVGSILATGYYTGESHFRSNSQLSLPAVISGSTHELCFLSKGCKPIIRFFHSRRHLSFDITMLGPSHLFSAVLLRLSRIRMPCTKPYQGSCFDKIPLILTPPH